MLDDHRVLLDFAAAAIYRILPVFFNDVWKRLAEAEDMTALRRRIYEYTP